LSLFVKSGYCRSSCSCFDIFLALSGLLGPALAMQGFCFVSFSVLLQFFGVSPRTSPVAWATLREPRIVIECCGVGLEERVRGSRRVRDKKGSAHELRVANNTTTRVMLSTSATPKFEKKRVRRGWAERTPALQARELEYARAQADQRVTTERMARQAENLRVSGSAQVREFALRANSVAA